METHEAQTASEPLHHYSEDEFEEIEAEGEANIEIIRPPPSGKLTFTKRMRLKSVKRTKRTSTQQRFESLQNENDEKGKTEMLHIGDGDQKKEEVRSSPRNDTCKGSMNSWIPTPVAGSHRTTVSSMSLQLDIQAKNSGSNVSLGRRRIGSQPMKKTSVVQQRLHSAMEIQIKDLTSKIRLLETKIQDLSAENRTLKTSFQIQAVALRKYEGTDSDFPKVLNYHQNEAKYLQQTLRKAQAACRKHESTIRNLNNKNVSLQDQNMKLQKLVECHELYERQKLQQELIEMNQELELAQEKLLDYERKFDLLHKNHAHQIGNIDAKLKASNKRIFDAEQELYRLTELIRQKDRVISYLRMRSRDPGLEPPLHRKVMEEYKSTYQYFYQVEQRSEASVNSPEHYHYRGSSIPLTDGLDSFRSERSSADGIGEETQPELYQGSSTAHSSQAEQVDTRSRCHSSTPKSNDTSLSEELARRSRERNLDVPCYGESEFEDEEVEEIPEQESEDNEEEVVEDEADVVSETEQEKKSTGVTLETDGSSGKTYVLRNGELEPEDFQAHNPDEIHDFFSENGQNKTNISGRSSLGPQNTERKRTERKKRKNQTTLREREDEWAYVTGEGPEKGVYYIARQEPEGTGAENGSGDAGRVEFLVKFEGSNGDETEEVEGISSDDERVKYSDEEFYCESGADNEAQDDENANVSPQQRSSTREKTASPNLSVRSKTFTKPNQYFVFASKPAYVGEGEDMVSDENNSTVASKYDVTLKSFKSSHSDAGTAGNKKTCAKQSTADSQNSRLSLHKKRPKGRGACDDSNSKAKSREILPASVNIANAANATAGRLQRGGKERVPNLKGPVSKKGHAENTRSERGKQTLLKYPIRSRFAF